MFALSANVNADAVADAKFVFNNDAESENSETIDCDAKDNDDEVVNNDAVFADADVFALTANSKALTCEPVAAKSDFVVASLLAEVCVLEAASKIFTCEPVAAKSIDDELRVNDSVTIVFIEAVANPKLLETESNCVNNDCVAFFNDCVANNIEAVFCPTSSNTVLIDEVSAFKEPVVRSISSARNISEAESSPTLLNLVLKEPVANPNELDTSAKTTDDDVNAPPANNDADVSAPCPNNAPDASAPTPNSFATNIPPDTDELIPVSNEPVTPLVNSKLSVTWADADVSAPCANAEAVTSAPCAKADAYTTAFSPNPLATKSDSCLEEVKETLISDCDMINEPVVSSILILLDIEADISVSNAPDVACRFVTS